MSVADNAHYEPTYATSWELQNDVHLYSYIYRVLNVLQSNKNNATFFEVRMMCAGYTQNHFIS